MPRDALAEALGRLRRARQRRQQVNLGPDSPFDALLDQRIKELERQVGELKVRINGLIFTMVGAVLLQLVLTFFR